MLSLQDCLDLSDVSDSELVAICRHEHIPPIVALELGQRLIRSAAGRATLRQFILDDIASAQRQGRCRDCEQFSRTLSDYIEKHPKSRKDPSDHDAPLSELLAVGQVRESQRVSDDPDEPRTGALRDLQEAKDRHDCCACRRLSLGLLRLAESAGDAAVTGKR